MHTNESENTTVLPDTVNTDDVKQSAQLNNQDAVMDEQSKNTDSVNVIPMCNGYESPVSDNNRTERMNAANIAENLTDSLTAAKDSEQNTIASPGSSVNPELSITPEQNTFVTENSETDKSDTNEKDVSEKDMQKDKSDTAEDVPNEGSISRTFTFSLILLTSSIITLMHAIIFAF